MEAWSAKPQLRVLLDHLARIEDTRQSRKVAYPLREVLFLVAGPSKHAAVARWRAGEWIPARAIRPAAGVDVLVTG